PLPRQHPQLIAPDLRRHNDLQSRLAATPRVHRLGWALTRQTYRRLAGRLSGAALPTPAQRAPSPLRQVGHSGVVDRVVVFGCAGSGKTTLARKLGERTGLTLVKRDSLGVLGSESYRAAFWAAVREHLGRRGCMRR